ncbi:MAG: acyl carrier protein [Candidatus Aminicenantales bacterium]
MRDKTAVSGRNDVESVLRRFISESFLPQSGLKTFSGSDSFLEKGIIDSTGILELLEFIEERFEIRVEDDEVIPDNLDSLDRLTRFIEVKIGHAPE